MLSVVWRTQSFYELLHHLDLCVNEKIILCQRRRYPVQEEDNARKEELKIQHFFIAIHIVPI